MTATRRRIWRGEASNVASNAVICVLNVPNAPNVIRRSDTKRPNRSSDLPHKRQQITTPVIINRIETMISRMSMNIAYSYGERCMLECMNISWCELERLEATNNIPGAGSLE
jgi:hypothetical protein